MQEGSSGKGPRQAKSFLTLCFHLFLPSTFSRQLSGGTSPTDTTSDNSLPLTIGAVPPHDRGRPRRPEAPGLGQGFYLRILSEAPPTRAYLRRPPGRSAGLMPCPEGLGQRRPSRPGEAEP